MKTGKGQRKAESGRREVRHENRKRKERMTGEDG